MPDQKLSELNELNSPADEDEIYVTDASESDDADKSKRLGLDTLKTFIRFIPTKANIYASVKAILRQSTNITITADDTNNELGIAAAATGGTVATVAPEEIHLDNVTIGFNANEVPITIDETATQVGTLITAVSNAGVTLRAGSYLLTLVANPDPASYRAYPQVVIKDTAASPNVISESTSVYYRSNDDVAGDVQRPAVFIMPFYLVQDTAIVFLGRQQDYDASEAGGVGQQVELDFTAGLIQPVGGIKGDQGNPGAPGTGASPTLANVVAALGLDAVAVGNRIKIVQRTNDETGFVYADLPAPGGGGMITRVNPSASQDSTNNGRPPQTVWTSANRAMAEAAIGAIANPSNGDLAYFRIVLAGNLDQIFMYAHHSGAWIPTGEKTALNASERTGVLDETDSVVNAIPAWNPSTNYDFNAIVRYYNELWIKVVDDINDRSEPSHAIAQDDTQPTIWFPMNTVSASEVPSIGTPPGGGNDRSVQAWLNHFAAQELYEPANLHTAYFPENSTPYNLPDAAGEYELAVLDPVNMALELVDGDKFIVHAALSGIPDGATTELQIRGRDTTTVTTDSVPFGAGQRFATLTLDTPGDEEDRTWVLYLRGTKPATSDASIGVNLREVVGVKGGTQPFAGSVAQMIEDYMYTRLALQYGVSYYENEKIYLQNHLVIDPIDGNVYRFIQSVRHSQTAPSANPTQWQRMTWPQPANWALESPDDGGLQLVPPSRIEYRLPPMWDATTSWPHLAQVIHLNAAYRNGSGGALTNVEPGTNDDWTLIANFSAVTPDDLLSQIADWAEQGNTQNIPNGKLNLDPRFVGLLNPSGDDVGRASGLYLQVANHSALLRSATDETAGLLSAALHAKLGTLAPPDWNTESGPGSIANKPTIPTVPSTSSPWPIPPDWSTIVNRPTIPGVSNPRGMWAVDIEYQIRDVVFDYNSQSGITVIAEAASQHVATLSNRPAGIDSASNEWDIIGIIRQSPHARSTTALDSRIAAVAPQGAPQWTYRGAWAVGTNYVEADVVTRNVGAVSVLAQAKRTHVATNANPPTTADSDDWEIIWSYNPSTAATKLNALTGNARLSYESLKDKPTIPDTTTTGFRWVGHWYSIVDSYPAGVTVGYRSRLYTSKVAIPAGTESNPSPSPPNDPTRWDEIMAMEVQLTDAGVIQYRLRFGEAGTTGEADWIEVNAGGIMIWRGDWAATEVYILDNFVEYGGWIWRCVTRHNSTTANRPPHAYWSRFAPTNTGPERTMVWYGPWVNNVAFPEGHVVLRSAHVYIAHNDAPAGNEPGVSAQWGSYWTRIV